jgi:hypothetical protein
MLKITPICLDTFPTPSKQIVTYMLVAVLLIYRTLQDKLFLLSSSLCILVSESLFFKYPHKKKGLFVICCHLILMIVSLSSSLALQPYVCPGLPQKLLPAKVSSIASSDFVTRVFSRLGLSAPRRTPSCPGGPMFSVRFVSHS